MTGSQTLTLALLLTCSHSAFAQQPPRPNETPRAVTLSLTEYNRLIDLAARPPQGALVAPVAAVLASANLRVRVERDTARGVFTVAGDALRPGVSRVSLFAGATLIDANSGGRPLPLIADGNAHTALIPGPGPFSLSLEWGAPLQFKPGRASFVLPVPQAGTARATFDLPGDQADVHLSSGLITSKSILDGRTIIEATLDPGSSTEVWWSMRDSAPTAAARELRALADVMTLITIGDSDVRMVALIDVSVVQGELRTAAVRLPAGYEVTGISGSSLETSEPVDGGLILTVGNPAARSHQFLVSLERPHDGGSFSVDTGFVSVRDVQRERGEVAIEGVGTLELTIDEREPMHRIDVRELNQALQSLARLPVLSAFRYQRSAGTVPALALEVKRFADAGVLAAIADRAVATTLVTSEGRALTEVVLTVQNRAQPFLKVTLPPGAALASVDVAGQPAKPVQGTDGTRVPLLRPGFRPTGSYQVSFVYLHAGTPFAKKGDIEMTLPKMDLPVGIVQWELFAPERYSMRTIGGNVMDVNVLDRLASSTSTASGHGVAGVAGGFVGGLPAAAPRGAESRPGRISVTAGVDGPARLLTGRVVDESGAVLPGVTIEVATVAGLRTVVTDGSGAFAVSDVIPGRVTVTATLSGFRSAQTSFTTDERARRLEIAMPVGNMEETVTVAAESLRVDVQRVAAAPPSQNVIDLQRRATGVLPVRIDVPRAGTSHQFIKPLVVDQETVVRLRYKRR
ncbi:MAG: carboxypeptidase-like regulatory domain-containing protein [Vicinamibacterales bacterium]